MTNEKDGKTVCTPGDKERAGRLLKSLADRKAAKDEAEAKYEETRTELQGLMESRGYDVVDDEDRGYRAVLVPGKTTERVDEKKLFAAVCEAVPAAQKKRDELRPQFTSEATTASYLKLTKG